MAADYFFREFEPAQQETLARATAAHQAYLKARQAVQPLKGGMHWKRINGREYLYKYRDRYGNGASLGPRSPETERLCTAFAGQRRDLMALLASQREHLTTAARFCRAALIHRVPEVVIRIARRLEFSGLAAASLRVIGVQALHAFEFAAGVFIEAPKDSPFWSDAAQNLTLAAATPVAPDELLHLLRQADRSFQIRPAAGFEAINKAGFLVRLVRPPLLRPQNRPAPHDTLAPTVPNEAGDLGALVSSPKFSQVVIGKRGTPATLVVPDPRALALHKLWLSQQEDRDPSLRKRDRVQGMALAELVVRYLPQYDFFSAQLNLFPPEAVRHAQGLAEGYEVATDRLTVRPTAPVIREAGPTAPAIREGRPVGWACRGSESQASAALAWAGGGRRMGGNQGGGRGQQRGTAISRARSVGSAKPVLDALKAPLPDAFANHYVIAVIGFPLPSGQRRYQDEQGDYPQRQSQDDIPKRSQDDTFDNLKQFANSAAEGQGTGPGRSRTTADQLELQLAVRLFQGFADPHQRRQGSVVLHHAGAAGRQGQVRPQRDAVPRPTGGVNRLGIRP